MKAYPKIFTIGTDYIMDIFNEEVEITEKIDGSQFGFGKTNEEVVLRSKGKQLFPEAPEKMFSNGIEYVSKIQSDIPENFGFYCEYLRQPKHNVLKYSRIPQNHLMLFGVTEFVKDRFYPNIDEYAKILGIESVPVLYKGKIDKPQFLLDLLETESILGGEKIEGMVVKNYSRSFLLGGQPIPIMVGKFVSEKFKERAGDDWKSKKTTGGGLQLYIASFRTEARWMKAIQHLRDNDELENSPRDIGKLMKELAMDLEGEETENIKNALYQLFIKDIKRKASAGFPEFYKEYLLKSVFQ